MMTNDLMIAMTSLHQQRKQQRRLFSLLFPCRKAALSFPSLFSPPENDSFRKDLSFTPDVFFSTREISEMRGPTGVKFCTMVSTRPNFIMPVQNFGGCTPKNFRGKKRAKFGPISDDFEVRRRISPKRIKILKIG